VGHINALECAWDWGMYGDAESCMWAAFNDHLHVLKWLWEDGATWDSASCHLLCWGTWVQLCCRMG
jgi:hypothetical protein